MPPSVPPATLPPVQTLPAPARLSPSRTVLESGVVVTAKETRKTRAVTINLAMRAGSICDPADLAGATFLLSKVIDRGTMRRSAADIAEALENRGIALSIGVNRHQVTVVCTCLSEDFEPVLAILGEVLVEPAFPADELSIKKGEAITAIAQDDDSPYVKALHGLLVLLYGAAHPYGRPPKGTAESVGRVTRDHLATLHRERFAPAELSAVVVGDVAPARVVDIAGRVFAGWNVPRPAPIALASPEPAAARRRTVLPMMNKSQADVAYGFTAIRRSDPAYHACSLMNNILGQYAMGGRLGDSIRERQGMAYYVSSALEAGLIEGPLMIRAGVSPANVDRAIQSIDDELRRIRAEGVTAQELQESRQYLVGSMPRALETNAGIAGFLQNAELFGLGLDYDVRMGELLGAVTIDDVHAAAVRLLDPDRASIVVTGPYSDASV